jgi:molybdenum cofactor synthesis domain-containing protein
MLTKLYTASIIIIGDEILSGKTQDINLHYIANILSAMGIKLSEARVIQDSKNEIISTVQELSQKNDFVFTTGGIGPTHDDLTSEAIAAAFNRELEYNKEALEIMIEGYRSRGKELSEGSKKMALMPKGVELIRNSASTAPGFRIENIFVMAGIPWVMQAMFAEVERYIYSTYPDLGEPFFSDNIEIFMGEGSIAAHLKQVQEKYPEVAIGSYPFKKHDIWGTNINFRSKDKERIKLALEELKASLKELKK